MSYAPPPAPAPGQPAGEVPLSAPLYGATFGQAFTRFWKKYATFTGRASRSEYWWWVLANAIIATVLYVIFIVLSLAGASVDTTTGAAQLGPGAVVGYVLLAAWALAVLIPGIALSWRRLHDTNRSGAFWFLGFIPLVGGIIVLVFVLLPPDPAGARFDV